MTQGVSVEERSVPLRTEKRLAEDSFLTDDFLRQLINVGEVDILVGLPTHNNAKTVGPIVQSIQAGILRDFPITTFRDFLARHAGSLEIAHVH